MLPVKEGRAQGVGEELAEQMVWIRWTVSAWDGREMGGRREVRSQRFLTAAGRLPLDPEWLSFPRQGGDRIKALFPKDGWVGKTRRRKEKQFGRVRY